jgi:hypothetical protein
VADYGGEPSTQWLSCAAHQDLKDSQADHESSGTMNNSGEVPAGNADSSPTQRALPLVSTAWSPSIGPGGRHRSERLVVINRNAWSSSIGTPGRHRSDRVVVINWRGWSPSIGIGGRHQPVCASHQQLAAPEVDSGSSFGNGGAKCGLPHLVKRLSDLGFAVELKPLAA